MNMFHNKICPAKFRSARLDNCKNVPAECVDYGMEWAKNPQSIFIHGPVGVGKTHYAFALIWEMMLTQRARFWPVYHTSPRLDSLLLKNLLDAGDMQILNTLAEADLLFIDDLGRETRSDRIKRQYFEIFDNRYTSGLPTIITSNLNLDVLSSNLDEAITSRFQEWMIMEIKGPDLRPSKQFVYRAGENKCIG